MSDIEALPEFYVTTDEAGRPVRIAEPAYEALTPCQIVMRSPETGATGPTRVEAGEIFFTEAIPCHQWAPLNRAAGERIADWVDTLPRNMASLPQECITEAAHRMRPREGEAELSHEQWWPAVLALASKIAEQRRTGRTVPMPRGAVAQRPGHAMPVMPFASQGPGMPMEVGRAPAQGQAGSFAAPSGGVVGSRGRRAAPSKSPMPGTVTSDAPSQATG